MTIEISNLDTIHVYDFKFPETRESQVLEQFTAQPTGPYHQHSHVLFEVFSELQNFRGKTKKNKTLNKQGKRRSPKQEINQKLQNVAKIGKGGRRVYSGTGFEVGSDEVSGSEEELVEVSRSALLHCRLDHCCFATLALCRLQFHAIRTSSLFFLRTREIRILNIIYMGWSSVQGFPINNLC